MAEFEYFRYDVILKKSYWTGKKYKMEGRRMKAVVMYVRFGSVEDLEDHTCKQKAVDWKQMWEDYLKVTRTLRHSGAR